MMEERATIGKRLTLTTGCGKMRMLVYFYKDTGEIDCTYIEPSQSASCANCMTGLSRMISLAIKKGATIDEICDQLNSCGICPVYAVARASGDISVSQGGSCPLAFAIALKQAYEGFKEGLKNEQRTEARNRYTRPDQNL